MALGFRFRNTLMRASPWLSFVATLGLAAWLHFGERGQSTMLGFAQADVVTVAPTDLGLVANVAVEPGQAVVAGQIVANLDSSSLDAEIAIVEASKTRLEALIPAEEAQAFQRLDESVEQIERELARQQEEYARAKAEVIVLEGERSRTKKLVEDKLAIGDDLAKLDIRVAAVQPIVSEKPKQLDLLRRQLKTARERREKAVEKSGAVIAAPVNGDLIVTARQLERLRHKRESLVLRAPANGLVTVIHKHAGEVVAAAEPIVSIVSARGNVVVCIPEENALKVGTGDQARLWVRGTNGSPLVGTTISLGPLVTELPPRCRRVPNLPAWGREATIALDTPVELLAGQAFDVEIHRGAVAMTPPASANTESSKSEPPNVTPVFINAPESLRALSRFEPSGLVFLPALSRYIVVSDDTGHEKKDEHAPWLFTMDEKGQVDPTPLVISGIEAFSDLESIAAGPKGELYVLASQSYNRKGERPPIRTVFLRLVSEGKSFRVDAQVHLAELLDSVGSQTLGELGISTGTRELDIEGMAGYHGALYLGLKSPLDAQGRALIWKLGNPEALFSTKTLKAAQLSLWAQAQLDADVDGRLVSGGISEMVFLPSGSMVLASTASREQGSTESGKLWYVPVAEGGHLDARLIKTFPGLKPEGLGLSAKFGQLVVVFDTGSSAPYWWELPWPQ